MNSKQKEILMAYKNKSITKRQAEFALAQASLKDYEATKPYESAAMAEVKQAGQSGEFAPEPVRHPDIDVTTRAVYKNLATDPAAGFNYLQKKHPELEFRRSQNGNVIAKRREGEDTWKYLDPPTGPIESLYKDPEDVTDVAWDVGAGLAESAASAYGGAKGAIAGLATGPLAPVAAPVLALGGAGASGAAAATALEGTRQTLGNMVGVSEEYSPEQMEQAAKYGFLSPLFFGTGAGKKLLAKEGLKKALTKEEMELLARSQSGVVGRTAKGVKSLLPAVGELASGVPKEVIAKARKELDLIKASDAMGGESRIAQDLTQKLQSAHTAKKQAAGEAYGDALKSLDIQVTTKEAQQPLVDVVNEYKSQVKAIRDDAIKATPVPKTMANFKTAYEQKLAEVGPMAVKETPEYINYKNKLDAWRTQVNSKVTKTAEFENYQYAKSVKDKYYKTKPALDGKEYAEHLANLNDITLIRKNADNAGKAKVDQRIINAAKQTAKNFDDQLEGFDSGELFKKTKQDYATVLDQEEVLQTYFKNPLKTEDTLLNIASPKKATRRQEVLQLGSNLGVDVTEPALKQKAISTFAKPSQEILSLGGTTSTSRTIPLQAAGGLAGYYAGANLDDNYGGRIVGSGLGAFFGGKMGSPAMMRRMMSMDQGLTKMGQAIDQPLYTPMTRSKSAIDVWKNVEEQK